MTKDLLLLNFIKAICVDAFELEEQIRLYKENLPLISEAYNFAKVTIKFEGVNAHVAPEKTNYAYVLYDSNDSDPDSFYEREFHTPEGSVVTIVFYAGRSNPWSEDDRTNVESLIQLIYIVHGRARIKRLLDIAVSTDGDTGLPNAKGFMAITKPLAADGLLSDYVLMFLNIKNFRIFTKREGNEAGDRLIKDYFAALKAICKKDEFCARPGGDNAIMLVKKENYNEALLKISQITIPLQKFARVIDIHIDTWVGVYFISNDATLSEAMSFASIALSSAKAGRGVGLVSVFNEQMMETFSHNKDILAEFPIAIKNKEFTVYYQPKAQINSQELVGAEGLVRWVKKGKVIPPFEFIPVLEEDGLIVDLDFYVLDLVCKDIHNWLEEGIEPVRVSTNFSRHHFHNVNTAERIINTLKMNDVPGKYIQIEITEMSGYSNVNTMLDFIKTLHDHDITVAIDDFGVGYSSINMLKDYNADIVKIDKSLLNDVEVNFKARMLLETMIKMSQSVGMDVVIEGVETLNQLAYVADIGCNLVQGYYFDKPLPKEDFIARLKNRTYTIE